MNEPHFQPPLSVNIVIFGLYQQHLSVLLNLRNTEPYSHIWALPEGYIDFTRDKNIDETAAYILNNLHLVSPLIEQVKTVGNRTRNPQSWSVAIVYYCLISLDLVSIGCEKEGLSWVPVEEALKDPLAFDHGYLLESALQRLQSKSLYTSLPIFLLEEEFTLTELQKVYELVLGFKMEKKSFRRRLLDAGFLKETGNIRRANHRPAQLYQLEQCQPYFFPRIIEGVRQ
jgi:8-oxo-dGTP diphosphatase